jgi:hypothetical protein
MNTRRGAGARRIPPRLITDLYNAAEHFSDDQLGDLQQWAIETGQYVSIFAADRVVGLDVFHAFLQKIGGDIDADPYSASQRGAAQRLEHTGFKVYSAEDLEQMVKA